MHRQGDFWRSVRSTSTLLRLSPTLFRLWPTKFRLSPTKFAGKPLCRLTKPESKLILNSINRFKPAYGGSAILILGLEGGGGVWPIFGGLKGPGQGGRGGGLRRARVSRSSVQEENTR